MWAVGGLVFGVVDIAEVGVVDASVEGYLSCMKECVVWGSWGVLHFVIGVEGGEVEGDIWAEVIDDPVTEGAQFVGGIVFAGDQECGDLEPDVGLVLEVDECVQDGLELGLCEFSVEGFGEGFEIDVGGVDGLEELCAGVGADVAGGDGYGFDAFTLCGLSDVDGVLSPDDRVVVGEGDAAAAAVFGGVHDCYWCGERGEGVHLSTFGDVPVLAELAAEVAACGPQ